MGERGWEREGGRERETDRQSFNKRKQSVLLSIFPILVSILSFVGVGLIEASVAFSMASYMWWSLAYSLSSASF